MNPKLLETKILNEVDTKFYILKQKTIVDNALLKPIEYEKTIAICTKLSDAIKIQASGKHIDIYTQYK